MEELLRALAATGAVRITALELVAVGLDLPGLREVIPARRPELPPGHCARVLWKLWFDQWACLRAHAARPGASSTTGWTASCPTRCAAATDASSPSTTWAGRLHPELYPARLRLMYGALFPWAVRRADRFIAVSRYTADDLIRRAGVPASRIDVVYHGLDPLFAPRRRGAGAGVPALRAGRGRRIAAQEHPPPHRGVPPLARARRTGRAVSPADHRHVAGSRVRARGSVPDGVTLLGYVDKAELPRLYAGAAAFLYPGIYEGFGLPIIEAMACGAPVVTSSTGAAPEIAGGAALIVDPFDAASIEAGLERIAHPEEAARLRALGTGAGAPFAGSRPPRRRSTPIARAAIAEARFAHCNRREMHRW